MSRDVLDALRSLLAHRTEDVGCYEFVLEAWMESAADEIERLRGEVTRLRKLGADACHMLQGSPVGSGCYEAHRMLDEQLTQEVK